MTAIAVDEVKCLLVEVPSNGKCADCKSEAIAGCVFPYGIYVCSECAHCHIDLPSSTVKLFENESVWNDEDLGLLREKGNTASNKVMEATLTPLVLKGTPVMNAALRKEWIALKYSKKAFTVGGPQLSNTGEMEGVLLKRGKAAGSKYNERQCKLVKEDDKYLFRYWIKADDEEPKFSGNMEDAVLFFEEDNPLQFYVLHEQRRFFFQAQNGEELYTWINAFRFAQARALGWNPEKMDTRYLAEMGRYLNAGAKCGVMEKSNPKGVGYKSRYFILCGLYLVYCKGKDESEMLRSLKLGAASNGTKVEAKDSKMVITLPGTDRKYNLKGSKDDVTSWSSAINHAIIYVPKFGVPAKVYNSRDMKEE
eukprot:m.37742 g.37742  ORF g.37742 m.37742 type:complete len:365 (-) comp10151_c0_seq1:73-1167(-)